MAKNTKQTNKVLRRTNTVPNVWENRYKKVADDWTRKVMSDVQQAEERGLHYRKALEREFGRDKSKDKYIRRDRSTPISDLQNLLFHAGFTNGVKDYKKFVDGIDGPNTQAALKAAQAAGYVYLNGKLIRKKPKQKKKALTESQKDRVSIAEATLGGFPELRTHKSTQELLEGLDLKLLSDSMYSNLPTVTRAVGAGLTGGAWLNSFLQGASERAGDFVESITGNKNWGDKTRKALGYIPTVSLDPASLHSSSALNMLGVNGTYSDAVVQLAAAMGLRYADPEAMKKAHQEGKPYTVTISDAMWKNAGMGVQGEGLVDKAWQHPARYTMGLGNVTFYPDGRVVASDHGGYNFNYLNGGGSGTYQKARQFSYLYGARESDNQKRQTHYEGTLDLNRIIK